MDNIQSYETSHRSLVSSRNSSLQEDPPKEGLTTIVLADVCVAKANVKMQLGNP